MNQSLPRFFATVEKLIDGLESGTIACEATTTSVEMSQIALTLTREGLRRIGFMLSRTQQRGAELCSQIWDELLLRSEHTLRSYFQHADFCISYWTSQHDFLLGHYTPDAVHHLGDMVFNKLPLTGSPVAECFQFVKPVCLSDTKLSSLIPEELSSYVGSLLAWPLSAYSGDKRSRLATIAVLLVEARNPGVIRDESDLRPLMEAISSLFEIAYHATANSQSIHQAAPGKHDLPAVLPLSTASSEFSE